MFQYEHFRLILLYIEVHWLVYEIQWTKMHGEIIKLVGENNPKNIDPENWRIFFPRNFDIAIQTRLPPPKKKVHHDYCIAVNFKIHRWEHLSATVEYLSFRKKSYYKRERLWQLIFSLLFSYYLFRATFIRTH